MKGFHKVGQGVDEVELAQPAGDPHSDVHRSFLRGFPMPRFPAFPTALVVFALAAFGGGYVAQRAVPAPAAAAVPAVVDGQAMPSLAPMLERVVPAVVSIQSKTVV